MSNHHLKPRAAAIGDNNPPTDANPLLDRLNDQHADLLDRVGALESAAAKLPKAEAITSDEQVAQIDAWVVEAKKTDRAAEAERVEAKDPYLTAGRTIDGFFGEVRKGLASRISGVEERKKPYLIARAARERAEREAREAAQRAEAERQRLEAARAAEAAEQARRDAEAERARLQAAEADRIARDQAAAAQAEADDEPTYETASTADVDDAERSMRNAEIAAANADRAREAAEVSAAEATKIADRDARALAGSKHSLSKVGASGIKSVWKAEVTDSVRLMNSLGALGAFLSSDAIEAALSRAARSDPLPSIPGVRLFEDFQVTTTTRGR